ncbi:MAG: YdiU family protein [Deltaproteobacteria bacterium]|nr:YdiU family protein [Deltaproteobacteria bacterium]
MNSPFHPGTLDSLPFDNRFVNDLPGDPVRENRRRQVTEACYSRVYPQKVSSPDLLAFSPEVAEIIGISSETCKTSRFTNLFSGNKLIPGMDPYAMCYGGHQFGSWAGQLGDGRAINLGEIVNNRDEHWTLQLKGAGSTPYSRSADGLAVLRSSVREFLCSEAMHHLGIPTTRALSLVTTGEQVVRDMFYDGNPKEEPGAVVCRVSPSFIRFGNFEILTARGETDLLQQLIDFTIRSDFPHLGKPSTATYLQWFNEICRTTAEMIIHWMRVGFVHGVMNTDNMSILGLTIDYGPYGWLENFDPGWTPNTTDSHGKRYCFKNQPHIGQWNLLQLANSIYPVINDAVPLKESLALYNDIFQNGWNEMMAKKLGFTGFKPESDNNLISELTTILPLVETDMTIFFRNLAELDIHSEPQNREDLPAPLTESYYRPEQLTEEYKNRIGRWIESYKQRSRQEKLSREERHRKMNRINPKYVLRNYMAQLAIDEAEKGNGAVIDELLELVRHPYDEQPENKKYAARRPDWARNRPGCSMLSCSS